MLPLRHLRLFSCWLLLLPMALVVAPRESLHACVHLVACDHHADGTPVGHDAAVAAHCAICAMDMLVAVPASVTPDVALTGLVLSRTNARMLSGAAASAHLPVDRGPPARA